MTSLQKKGKSQSRPEEESIPINAANLNRFVKLVTAYMLPYWKRTGVLVVGSYVAAFLLAILPLVMAAILDIALNRPVGGGEPVGFSNISLSNLGALLFQILGIDAVNSTWKALAVLSGLYLTIGTLYAASTFANYMLALRIRVSAGRDMQADLFKHILGMSMGFFNRHRTGELVSRLDKDTNAVTSNLEDVVIKLLVGPALVLFYGFLLIRTSSMLAVAAGAAVLLHFALTRGVQNPIKRRVADQFNAFANLAAGMFETILSIRVVKSFAGEEYEHEKLKADIQSVVETNMRYGVFKHLQEPIRLVINYFLEASIVLIAGIALIAGDLNVASFILFLYVGRATLRPIAELATAITGVHTALGASTRVLQLFDQQPEVMDGPLKIESFNDSIAIKNVTFAYGEAPAIRNVSLDIKKGEQVAFVGPSGAGKSTLSDLLLRFYDPQEGNILIDGIDIREFEQRSLRKLFGVVPQEPLLFNATIEENITYGRSNITRQDILAATEIANAHSFVSNLPNGYDTFVGDRGIRLSGGQRQRIAIARAVAGKPPIMIFDEATSSLDSESERLVQEAVDRVLEEVTGIIIAHRLSTILRADKIVVVNDGLIEAVGRHEELRETSQTYRHLLELQSLVPEIA